MPFHDTWNYIQHNFCINQKIKRWTNETGYLVDEFKLVNMSQNFILIDSPDSVAIQTVPKDQCESVYTIWSQYKTDSYTLHQINELARFGKYIISILYWAEENNNGILP